MHEVVDIDKVEGISVDFVLTVKGERKHFLFETPSVDTMIKNQALDAKIKAAKADKGESPDSVIGFMLERILLLLPTMTEEEARSLPFPKLFGLSHELIAKVNAAIVLINPTTPSESAPEPPAKFPEGADETAASASQ